MFEKILVANRGEIALRILRACRELGIKTVAVHSTADADAMHVRLADHAVCIGPPPAKDSYLNVAAIISAAEIAHADAILVLDRGQIVQMGTHAELSQQDGFYRAFQYPEGHLAAAFLLFGLSTGLFSFWLAPLQHACSRRFEYQADAFAAAAHGERKEQFVGIKKKNPSTERPAGK